MNQKNYFELLEYISIGPIYAAQSLFFHEKYVPGKRVYLENSKFPIDYRTVISNEIIFELDAKSYSQNYKYAKKIIDVLKQKEIPFYIFASGGKGIHIQIYFKKINWKLTEHKELFKKAIKYGFKFKDLRMFVFNSVLDETDIHENLRSKGGLVDTNSLLFDDEKEKTRLIRVCGGRKQTYDSVYRKTETLYKTFVPLEEFTKIKPRVTKYENVKWTEKVECFEISQQELSGHLDKFIKNRSELNLDDREIKLDGLYIDLPGVKKIREGMPTGLRAEGSKILSIALKNDEFSQKLAIKEVKEYAKNCSQIGDKFSEKEALNWLSWVYNQEHIFWNCGLLKELGPDFHDDTCEFCKKQKKEIFDFLESKDLLKKIDEYLKKVIVGEKNTRILIFLLILSKKFKVDKNWNVESDPKPASIILSSMSSSGKSYITKQILRIFGKENIDYYMFSRMTKSVLNYFGDIDMNDKVLFVEELQSLDESSNQLRLWISEGKLKLATVEKVEIAKEIKQQIMFKETRGQPIFITGTAEDAVDDQLNNRSWLISLDISKEQNEKILKFQDDSNIANKSRKEEIRMMRESISELDSYHFFIPYMNYKVLNIPTDDVRVRRDYKKLRDLICCSTLLHQRQRMILMDDQKNEYLVAEIEDYEVAKEFCNDVLSTTFMGTTTQQLQVLKIIQNSAWKEDFTRSQIQKLMGYSTKKMWMILTQLEELSFILSEKNYGESTKYKLNPRKNLLMIPLPEAEKVYEYLRQNPIAFSVFSDKMTFYNYVVTKNSFRHFFGKGCNQKLPKVAELMHRAFSKPFQSAEKAKNVPVSIQNNTHRAGENQKIAFPSKTVCMGHPTNLYKQLQSSSQKNRPNGRFALVSDLEKATRLAKTDFGKISKFLEHTHIFTRKEFEEKFGEESHQELEILLQSGDVKSHKDDRFIVTS